MLSTMGEFWVVIFTYSFILKTLFIILIILLTPN